MSTRCSCSSFHSSQARRGLESLDKNQPYATAGYYGSLLRAPEKFAYGRERVLSALQSVEIGDVKDYFKREGRVRALVQGGLSEAEVRRSDSRIMMGQ